MLARLLAAALMHLALATPARADDISAAARGVVRVVTIASVDRDVVDLGHGSGFAVAPNRIVTNAHVFALEDRYPGNVVIRIVPSQGGTSYEGRLVTVDPARDLALVAFDGAPLAPLTLYAGPTSEGDVLIALGYPGNVDLASVRSLDEFITPLAPVRSQGVFSGSRNVAGNMMLLHTANLARGNSGGPLLDRCGRVIGVNAAITRGDEGDSSFAFAIADGELAAFLREAKQPVASVGVPCASIQERLAADQALDADARNAAAAGSRDAATRAAAERDAAIASARAANLELREDVMAVATLLLVLGALAVGGGGLLAIRGDARARWAAGGGVALMLAAVTAFVLRPRFDAARAAATPAGATPSVADAGPAKLVCTLDPARSRVTVSATAPVTLDWRGDGCMNGRTQYAEDGHGGWNRVLVPETEATVSILDYQPATRSYVNTRYLLDDAAMDTARRRRGAVTLKTCSTDNAARAALAGQQAAVRAALPPLPNEKLVYTCKAPGG